MTLMDVIRDWLYITPGPQELGEHREKSERIDRAVRASHDLAEGTDPRMIEVQARIRAMHLSGQQDS